MRITGSRASCLPLDLQWLLVWGYRRKSCTLYSLPQLQPASLLRSSEGKDKGVSTRVLRVTCRPTWVRAPWHRGRGAAVGVRVCEAADSGCKLTHLDVMRDANGRMV